MNPMRESTDRGRPGIDLALRLVLAVLIALAPLLSVADAPASMAAADPLSAQPPCHSSPPGPGAAADPCPHCDADTPLGHCGCCDQAAPAGPAPLSASAHFDFGYSDRYRTNRPRLSPRHAVECLYRPPIRSA